MQTHENILHKQTGCIVAAIPVDDTDYALNDISLALADARPCNALRVKIRKGSAMQKTKTVLLTMLWAVFLMIFPIVSGIIATIRQMKSPDIMILQGIFMVIPVLIAVFPIKLHKLNIRDLGLFGKPNHLLYLLPVVIIYLPHMVRGCVWKGTGYFLATLFLYLFVGIAEELYFRGIIPLLLQKSFTDTGVIVMSTGIFAIAHIAQALSGNGLIITVLTIINASLFGFLAIVLKYINHSILPVILIHFLFDFETKFTVIEGTELAIAEGIRGMLLLILGFIYYKIYQSSKTTISHPAI